MPISTFLYRSNPKIRLTMLCLSGFELFSRWVPLQRQRRDLLFFLVKESDHFRLQPVIGHTIVFTSETEIVRPIKLTVIFNR